MQLIEKFVPLKVTLFLNYYKLDVFCCFVLAYILWLNSS